METPTVPVLITSNLSSKVVDLNIWVQFLSEYKLKSKAATELTPILSPKEESERLKFTVLLL